MGIQGSPATCGWPLDHPSGTCYTPTMNNKPTYPNPWHPDDPAEWSPVTKSWRFSNVEPIPKELEKLMWSGKLSQMCPYCNHVEPAGAFCHNCSRQVHPDSYFRQQAVGADGKPRRGRPSKADIARMVGTIANA